MISLLKGLIPGSILTFVVAGIMGSNGASGAWLEIHRVLIGGQTFYWSWPLFLVTSAIAWGIIAMMD